MSTESTESTQALDSAASSAGALETRGIEPVPAGERHGRPMELFWVWFAANISILGLPLGATLVAFQGLTVWQAVIVAALGAVGSFAIVGVLSIAGKRGGAPGLTLSRAVFGVRGNAGPTAISLLSRLGWETVNTTTAAFTLLSLCAILFGTQSAATANPALTIGCIAVFVLLTVIVSGLGHRVLLVVQKWSTWIFGALNIVVAINLVATIDWAAVSAASPAPIGAMIAGVGIIAAGTGIGWANAAADMSRYQGAKVGAGSLIASAAAGAGIPLVLLISLGSLLSAGDSTLAEAGDPVAAIRDMLPSWMAVPYLVAAFGGLLLSNHLSVYSAGLTTLTLGLRVKRVYAVVVDVVITFLGAIYFMLIADNFYAPFIAFISLLAIPITAWVGVFLVDMLGRRSYDPVGLMDMRRTSSYWYRGGIEPRALTCWAVAILAGYLFTTAGVDSDVWFTGPFADTWLGVNGLGWVITFAIAAGGYAALGGARRGGSR
ncbi:purine-cytosine permease-like protein [Tamaricihabitans halophyticus]|uniref:Purine-cytosine permease-like protein n=1 Tax=Tamaricihabitans halophyticus TaxID=1262583 RepID=A0A4R2QKP0_9PSEU|nr:cytosine permease [Tamaricihabitans halophyticus]TCP50012.1 purine-cytosine permease-like protein [Tamaricihabitans halophyticus]